jgi:hypothetical protein
MVWSWYIAPVVIPMVDDQPLPPQVGIAVGGAPYPGGPFRCHMPTGAPTQALAALLQGEPAPASWTPVVDFAASFSALMGYAPPVGAE